MPAPAPENRCDDQVLIGNPRGSWFTVFQCRLHRGHNPDHKVWPLKIPDGPTVAVTWVRTARRPDGAPYTVGRQFKVLSS